MVDIWRHRGKIALFVVILLLSGIGYGVFATFINTNAEPEADIQTNARNFEQTLDSVQVSAENSTDPDGDSLQYSFDTNNDGVFEVRDTSNPVINPSFPSEGVYTVTVRVSDGSKSDTVSTIVRVNERPNVSDITLSDAPRDVSSDTIGVNTIRVDVQSSEELETLNVSLDGENINRTHTIDDFQIEQENRYVSLVDVQTPETRELTASLSSATDEYDVSVENTNVSDSITTDSLPPVMVEARSEPTPRNISVLFSDNLSGINISTIQRSDFTLVERFDESTREKTVESINFTERDGQIVDVKITSATEIEANELVVSVENGSIEDNLGNGIDDSNLTISQFDVVAPRVEGSQVINATAFRILFSDSGGSGIDGNSISKGRLDIGLDTEFTLSSLISPENDNPRVNIILSDPVDSVTTTLTIENLSDNAGNSRNVTTRIEIPDGVSPRIENISRTSGNNIRFDVVDNGAGVNDSTVTSESFNVSDATIEDVTKQQISNGVSITLELTNVSNEEQTVSLVGEVSDNSGNRLSDYSRLISGFQTSGGSGSSDNSDGSGSSDNSDDSGYYSY
jgi:hypothetical protein